MRVTKKMINKALPKGYEIDGSIQDGCYHFIGNGQYGDTFSWYECTVWTCKLSDQSIKEWVQDFIRLYEGREG